MSAQRIARLTGIAAVLMHDNIDTDQIIPSSAIRLEKEGIGRSLFSCRRYLEDARSENPEFVLNRPPYRQASFLIAGANFGCGSSREAAVWALKDFGITAIIAESFGNIFFTNCVVNGIVPVRLNDSIVERLAVIAEQVAGQREFCIDIRSCEVQSPGGAIVSFSLPSLYQGMLVTGGTMTDAVLDCEADITDYEQRRQVQQPWIVSACSE